MLGGWKKAIGEERRFWSEYGQVLVEREEVENKYQSIIHQVEKALGVTACWRILDVGSGPAPVVSKRSFLLPFGILLAF